MMGPGRVTPAKKKPVSDVVMDFGSVLGEEAEDPTKDLVKDFRINLDDYRAPEQARELGLKAELPQSASRLTAPSEREARTAEPETAGKQEEVKLPPVRKEEPKASAEVQPDPEAVKTAPKAKAAEPDPSSWYQSAKTEEAEEEKPYIPKH